MHLCRFYSILQVALYRLHNYLFVGWLGRLLDSLATATRFLQTEFGPIDCNSLVATGKAQFPDNWDIHGIIGGNRDCLLRNH